MALSAARNVCREFLNLSCRRLTLQPTILNSQIKSLHIRTNFNTNLIVNKFRFCSEDSSKRWVTILFERHDGTLLKRKAKVGDTLQAIIGQENPDFPGYGACDGTISCSTCHVILSKEDFQKLGEISDDEDDTLDLSPGLTETSRLGCCINVTPEMDGMVFKLPAEVKDLRDRD